MRCIRPWMFALLAIILMAWVQPAFAGEATADSRGSPIILEIQPATVVAFEEAAFTERGVVIALAVVDQAEEGDGATQAPGEPSWYDDLSLAVAHAQSLFSGEPRGKCYVLGLRQVGSVKSVPLIADLLFSSDFGKDSGAWGAGASAQFASAGSITFKAGLGILREPIGYLSAGF